MRSLVFLALTIALISLLAVRAVSALPIQPLDGVLSATDASSVVVPPDGRHVYAVSPAGLVTVWARDEGTGQLNPAGNHQVDDRTYPTRRRFLFVLDDHRQLLFTTYRDTGPLSVVTVLDRDPRTGALNVRTEIENPGAHFDLWGACDASLSHDGAFLYVAVCNAVPGDMSSGAIVTLSIEPETAIPTVVGSRETDSATAVMVSPDDRHVFVAHNGSRIIYSGPDVLAVYARDPITGSLSFLDRHEMDVETWSNPDLAMSPDGRDLYVLTNAPRNSAERTALFSFGLTGDTLVQRDLITTDQPGFSSLLDAQRLQLTPDGQSLIATTSAYAIVFSRDARSGQIALHGSVEVPTASPWATTTFDPSGSRFYRLNDVDQTLEPYAIGCTEGANTRCLGDGRFHLFAEWRNFAGRTGIASAVNDPNARSALFSFFAEDNWEVLAKTVDGCDANSHFWSFAAGTTNVAYRLRWTDTWTGASRVYENPLGTAAAATTDTRAFATCDAIDPFVDPLAAPVERSEPGRTHPGDDCGHGNELCLLDARYQATATWRDFSGRTGTATAVGLRTDRSGLLWFFNNDNWELLVKMVDGCALNDHTWVFAAGTTNVAYELTVLDTHTGESRTYENPLGTASPAVTDTQAFANCHDP